MLVNGYPTGSINNLGFDYVYLYYEPEINNIFKIAKVGTEFVKVNLTNEEILLIDDFCKKFVPEVIPEPVATEDPKSPLVHVVTADRLAVVIKPENEVQEDEIVIPAHIAAYGRHFSSVDNPDFIWDDAKKAFDGITYQDKRLLRYYSEIRLGNQLDAIWDFIDSIVLNGQQVPQKTLNTLEIIKQIKRDIPKV